MKFAVTMREGMLVYYRLHTYFSIFPCFQNPIHVDAEIVPMYGEDSFANPMQTTNVAETIFSGSEDEQEYFHVRIGSELW